MIAFVICEFLSIVALVATVVTSRREIRMFKKNAEHYESLYNEERDNYTNLRAKVDEFPVPEGCKRGDWCKACRNSVTVSATVKGAYGLFSSTPFVVCGLDQCDEFEKRSSTE